MGDVAQILGVAKKEAEVPKAVKILQLPKPVLEITGDKLPTAVPAQTVKLGNKTVQINKRVRKWVHAPFSSSSRTDGLLLHHWVRANVEYPDYPYARFDIHLDPVVYNSDEEYKNYLRDPDWSKSETDHLLELAKAFELRWPVVHDRWCERFGNARKIEDIQHRYYSVAAIIYQLRISHEAATEAQVLASRHPPTAAEPKLEDPTRASTDALLIETAAARSLASSDPKHQPLMQNLGTGSTNKFAFDLKYERERREHMEVLWNRTKKDEAEELELRKELKEIEAKLRKLKKTGAHILSAGGSRRTAGSRSNTPDPFFRKLDKAFCVPTPVPGFPYLQSARLQPPAAGGSTGINKSLLKRMGDILKELKVPDTLLPTKRVCDSYDRVRKDILSLLVLQKTVLQREGSLASQRLALAKKGGRAGIADEETLLGIEPPRPPPKPAPRGLKNPPKNTTTSKAKSPKSAPKEKSKDKSKDKDKSAPKKSGNATKRKRKSDASKSPTAPAMAAAAAAAAAAAVKAAPVVDTGTKPASKKRVKKSGA